MHDINFCNTGVRLFLAKEKALLYPKSFVPSRGGGTRGDCSFYPKPCLQSEILNPGLALMVVR